MPEYAAEKHIRLATEREVGKVAADAAVERAALQTTIDEQAQTIAALTAQVEQTKQDITALDAKIDAAVEVKP